VRAQHAAHEPVKERLFLLAPGGAIGPLFFGQARLVCLALNSRWRRFI
jgi:hypothetical protein